MTLEKLIQGYYEEKALPAAEVERILAAAEPAPRRGSSWMWAAAAVLLLAAATLAVALLQREEAASLPAELTLADPAPVPSEEAGTVAHPGPAAEQAATAQLLIDSDPPGAKVFIDGALRGRTPLRLDAVAIGSPINVRLWLAGYAVSKLSVQPEAGEKRHLQVNLRPDETAGWAPAEWDRAEYGKTAGTRKLYKDGVDSLQRGRLADALQDFRLCMELDPKHALCARALGITYSKTGNGPKAYRYYKRYLQLDPEAKDAPQVRAFLHAFETSQ